MEFRHHNHTISNIEKFKQEMTKYKIPVTIRREMGSDISASCGQLRRSVVNNN